MLPQSSATIADEDLNDMPFFELPGADLSGEELTVTVVPVRADEFTCSSCFWCSTATDCAAPPAAVRSALTARDEANPCRPMQSGQTRVNERCPSLRRPLWDVHPGM